MKKVILLCGFAFCLFTIAFAFNSHNLTVPNGNKPEVQIIKSENNVKWLVVVDCDGNNSYEFSCACSGSNCEACLTSAYTWLAAGGCNP